MSDSGSGPIDLGDLQLKPQWVDQLDKPNQFENFEGTPERRERRGDSHGPGSGGGGGGNDRRRSGGPREGAGNRRTGPGGGRPQGQRDGNRDNRGGEGGRNEQRGPRRDGRSGGDGKGHPHRRPAHDERPPLYELLDIELLPEPVGMEAVCRQIKMTGRSYSIFDLAKLVLGGPERFQAKFTLKPETKQVQLIECKLDNSLWLSMAEALQHFRSGPQFSEYYKKEEVDVGPPKGNFAVIAVCGLSGTLLGPPNFHSYQKNLNDLHQREFSRMHIDAFKRRIRMVRDEETIEKWKASLSNETHYTYLKAAEGEDAAVFKTAAEAERHFVEKHSAETFVQVKSSSMPGTTTRKRMSDALCNMLRRNAERQQKFPMPMVKNLSPLLEHSGLKFFKLGEKETYVARSRPKVLNLKDDMSARIHAIVGFIRNNPGEDLNKLVSALVATTPETAKQTEPTPEEIDVLKDLRWLIREGYVLEFSNGQLRMASEKGPFKPKRPDSKKKKKKSAKPSGQQTQGDTARRKDKVEKTPTPLRLVRIVRCKSLRRSRNCAEVPASKVALGVALKRAERQPHRRRTSDERRVVKRLLRKHG